MTDTDTLTILEHFRTQQQTSEWSCGVTSALMVMDWYGTLGDYNEETLAQFRSNGLTPEATSLQQLIEVFEGVGGYDLYSTLDCENVYEEFTLEFIQETLANDTPIIVGWNDWGCLLYTSYQEELAALPGYALWNELPDGMGDYFAFILDSEKKDETQGDFGSLWLKGENT